MGYDCVIIPGAAKAASPFALIKNQAFCGGLLVTVNSAAVGSTICSEYFEFIALSLAEDYNYCQDLFLMFLTM